MKKNHKRLLYQNIGEWYGAVEMIQCSWEKIERRKNMEEPKKDEIEIKREWIIEAVRTAEPGDILILERVILILTK